MKERDENDGERYGLTAFLGTCMFVVYCLVRC